MTVMLMTVIEILLLIAIGLVTLPWVAYTTAKLSAYGYLRGRELFDNRNKKEKD